MGNNYGIHVPGSPKTGLNHIQRPAGTVNGNKPSWDKRRIGHVVIEEDDYSPDTYMVAVMNDGEWKFGLDWPNKTPSYSAFDYLEAEDLLEESLLEEQDTWEDFIDYLDSPENLERISRNYLEIKKQDLLRDRLELYLRKNFEEYEEHCV